MTITYNMIMTLNEFQRQTLIATGQEYLMEKLDADENLSNLLLPRTPHAQGLRHELGGLIHTIDLVNCIAEGDIQGAEEYLDQLRTQVAKSTRGVAKDALPVLQALGLIDDFFVGGVTIPDNFDLVGVQEDLAQREAVAHIAYRREQYPSSGAE